MRDSHNPDSAVLVSDHSEWTNFHNGIATGDFRPTLTDRQRRSPQPVYP
jgi:Domain of unknown function (DUF397)